MKFLLTLKHWQLFLILTIGTILNLLFNKLYFTSENFTFFIIADLVLIITLYLFFNWILAIGSLLNGITDNPYHFNKVLFILAILFCFIGYAELSVESIPKIAEKIPDWVSIILTFLTFWGVIYAFYKVSKSLKSLELNRKAKFSEHILDGLLLFAYPIGIWIVQPKINILVKD